jgi:hypothetical protein
MSNQNNKNKSAGFARRSKEEKIQVLINYRQFCKGSKSRLISLENLDKNPDDFFMETLLEENLGNAYLNNSMVENPNFVPLYDIP